MSFQLKASTPCRWFCKLGAWWQRFGTHLCRCPSGTPPTYLGSSCHDRRCGFDPGTPFYLLRVCLYHSMIFMCPMIFDILGWSLKWFSYWGAWLIHSKFSQDFGWSCQDHQPISTQSHVVLHSSGLKLWRHFYSYRNLRWSGTSLS